MTVESGTPETEQPVNDTPEQGNQDTPQALDGEQETHTEIKSSFPDDWQELMAGDDEKTKAALSRYGSPKDVAKALREAQVKLSERNKIVKPNENATEDDLKSWRDAWGIPQSPEEYKVDELFKGEIGEQDKPIIDEFVKNMHDTHATPEQVKTAINAYYDIQAKNEQYLQEVNKQDAIACEEDLREEWGRNFTGNKTVALDYIQTTFGKEASEVLTQAIGSDGRMLMNNPEILRAFANLGLAENPRHTMPQGATSIESLSERKAQIQSAMRSGKYDSDSSMQAEYKKIVEYEEKIGKRI